MSLTITLEPSSFIDLLVDQIKSHRRVYLYYKKATFSRYMFQLWGGDQNFSHTLFITSVKSGTDENDIIIRFFGEECIVPLEVAEETINRYVLEKK